MKNAHLIGLASMLFLVAACSAASDTDADPAADETPASGEAELKSKKKKTCASIGGSCVGLSPSSCAGGSWADAKQASCGTGIGVGCCVPAPSPTPASNACEAAGGTCVGLAPSSCAPGKWADASTHSCGGGIGVGCCLR